MSDLPSFQQLLLPLLRCFADGNEHRLSSLEQPLAEELALTAGQVAIKYHPADTRGRTIFSDRVSWARTFLGKASLIERTAVGTYLITKRGQALLLVKPNEIKVKDLKMYSDFEAAWKGRKKGS